jgi:hypothetical protein
MPCLAVPFVPTLGVCAQKHAHEHRQGRVCFRFDEQMKMIVHETEIDERKWMPFIYFCDNAPQQVFVRF